MIVNWRMSLVAWVVMPCHFIGGLIQAKSTKGVSGDYSTACSKLVALVSDATNIRTIASFCHKEEVLKKAKTSLEIPMKKYSYGIIVLYPFRDMLRQGFYQQNEFIFGSVFGACRTYGNIDIGKQIMKQLLVLGRYDSGLYVLLSNMYSRSQRWYVMMDYDALKVVQTELHLGTTAMIERNRNEEVKFAVGCNDWLASMDDVILSCIVMYDASGVRLHARIMLLFLLISFVEFLSWFQVGIG
ncbi:ABC transporter type 1, transmembrane domain [Sesbania bispinosa]|nr:ABC transporter type 1, transmembrane domain [Sesbania bispinosa]